MLRKLSISFFSVCFRSKQDKLKHLQSIVDEKEELPCLLVCLIQIYDLSIFSCNTISGRVKTAVIYCPPPPKREGSNFTLFTLITPCKLTIQGPPKNWTDHFTQSHILKLQLRGDLAKSNQLIREDTRSTLWVKNLNHNFL